MTNISMGGNSSYAVYARLMALDYEAADQAADYDLVIFCYGQNDGIHPNAAGQEIYKNVIAEVIHQAVKAGLGHSRWNNSPVHDNVEKFDHFAWFKADEFQREGNTFTLKLKEIITGTLAIYSYHVPGENAYQIYVDNTEIFNHEFDWPYGFCQAYIVEIADNCTVNSAVRISFETETQADGFQGICFNWE